MIICEGESEKIFLEEYFKENIKKYKIIKCKSLGFLKRCSSVHPGYKKYIFIHDTDNKDKIEQAIKDAKNTMNNNFIVYWNDPCFDFMIAECMGIYSKNQRDILKKLKEIFKKSKKIGYSELTKKGGNFSKIRNKDKYDILKLLDLKGIK